MIIVLCGGLAARALSKEHLILALRGWKLNKCSNPSREKGRASAEYLFFRLINRTYVLCCGVKNICLKDKFLLWAGLRQACLFLSLENIEEKGSIYTKDFIEENLKDLLSSGQNEIDN